jgi:hypothetical protein
MGRTMTEEQMQIAREDRTANGRAVRDIIAVKRKWTLEYSLIDHDDLVQLMDLYNSQDELTLEIYYGDTTSTTVEDDSGGDVERVQVLMQPITRTRVLGGNARLWANVAITLDEV